MDKHYLIGICGGSASGKTFLLQELMRSFPKGSVTLISQDNYYFDLDDQVKDEFGQVNFDHPRAVNLKLLKEHLEALMTGHPVSIREYHFNNPAKEFRMITYRPAPIILVEGMFVYYREDIRDMFNLKLFVDAEPHEKFARRIQRDREERGYPLEDVMQQYRQFVIPMYRRFVEPFKYEADMILNSHENYRASIRVLENHIRYIIGCKEKN